MHFFIKKNKFSPDKVSIWVIKTVQKCYQIDKKSNRILYRSKFHYYVYFLYLCKDIFTEK